MEGQKNETISVQDELELLVLDANVLEFCRLLAYIESPVVPKALFDRACRPRVVWTESGKLGSVPPDYSKVPDWLVQVFDTREPLEVAPLLQQAVEKGALSITQQDGFLASICLEEKRRNTLRIESSQASSLRHLFDILAVVVHAFPETHAELLWEETEAQVWDVVESTILPLLAVSTVGDILVHILPADTTGQINFLQALLSFLSRITAIIGKDIYPSITQLHEDLFAHFLKVSYEAAPLLRDDISRFLFYAPAAVQLSNMLHMQSNERLNAMRVLSRDASLHGLHKDIAGALSWTPLARGKPSAMEILAMGISHGASTVVELFGISLHSMPPQVVGILGFLAAKQQSFDVARNILESSIADIKDLYSVVSKENLLTGIELVKCYNFLMDEIEGEKLARSLWSEVFGLEGGKMNITSLYQAYLAVVLADSLIGQSKYDDAQQILLEILRCKDVSSEVIVSTSLRLLKMSRRQRVQSPGFDTWHLLESAVGYIEDISDVLKYECVDEAMCHISILDEDPAQIPRAEAAITALSRISVKHFAGSETSKQNLVRHICALQQYRTGFKLFSVTGPQLHFSRLIRDGFPSASISFIERIGAANWNRFKRVKELPLRTEIIMNEPCHGDGKTIAGRSDRTFTDSALGSSLQTASKRARTQISYQSVGSAIGGSLENFPPMPVPSSKGKSFECPICCKRLRGIVSAAQWEHHVYADLQPYVCILDGCSSRMTTFGSRLEFTNHMYEHQYSNEWICKACQFKQEDLSAVEQHVAKSHPELEVKSTVLSTHLRRDMAKEQCPFCGSTPGYRFFGHVCRHLEEVALSILRKEVEWDSGSEEGESDPELSESFCGLCRISGHDITTCSELSYSSPDKIYLAVTQQSDLEKIVPLQFGSFDRDDMRGRNLPASANNPEFGDLDHNGRTVAPIPDILSIFSNSNFRVRSSPFTPPIPNPLPSGRRPEVPVFGSFDYITRHQRPLHELNYGWDKYFPSMTDLYYDKGWSVETIHQHIQDPATGFTPSCPGKVYERGPSRIYRC
ncbi:hypothetical protein BKA65DRAFT_204185 [Rhexocercosporidium sp. MPI-PUGE-AT-0058]|nr:hypothetical protein BKA65DRAFT_204185 [Rhexocercosporidium sp. MPI-PUGE-AT-0058]